QLVQSLLRASPLTDLLEPLRLDPALDLDGPARWLADPEIARAVADRWLQLGLAQVSPPVTAAVLRLFERKHPHARLALSFVCHLQLLVLISSRPGAPGERLPEMQAQAQAQPALRELFGLFAAAQRAGIGRPADVARDPRLAEAVDDYATACAQIA